MYYKVEELNEHEARVNSFVNMPLEEIVPRKTI